MHRANDRLIQYLPARTGVGKKTGRASTNSRMQHRQQPDLQETVAKGPDTDRSGLTQAIHVPIAS
ncbi:hypothetical protein LHGZ1_1605 [Laribacter hongkongensis]|uniref:Uncharacterized protein n=1 Tax=Laribacter hongkongensis TaxID=168471 RepID=A0A248LJ90_9NEIS|nr:hypothetical protein LHGZ1_1605 [Laribacter hongkongensis]